jgi:hypothetical protein
MRSIAAALVLSPFLLLAACSQPAPAEVAAADAADAADASAPTGTALPEALPQGFTLGFPYHYTNQETTRAGKAKRQRISVEYLAGDANSTAASLAQSALAAGFNKGLWGVQKDGSIHFVADKAGYGQLRAQIRPAGSEPMHNPAAKGTLTMGWPVTAKRPVAAATTPAAQ